MRITQDPGFSHSRRFPETSYSMYNQEYTTQLGVTTTFPPNVPRCICPLIVIMVPIKFGGRGLFWKPNTELTQTAVSELLFVISVKS